MARKTVDVTVVRQLANTMLRVTKDDEVADRRGIIAMIESVLHRTDNYKGFRYLDSEKNPNGTLKDEYDDTRREYY